MQRVALAVISLVLFLTCASASCPGISDADLQAQRTAILKDFVERPNLDWAHYEAVSDLYVTDDYTIAYVSVGVFGPKNIALEYARVAWDANGQREGSFFFLSNQLLTPSIQWVSTDVVQYRYLNNFTVNYTSVGGALVVTNGLSHFAQVRFHPCQVKIDFELNTFDPIFVRVLQDGASTVPVSSICNLVQFACPVGSQYEQYPTLEACIAFMSNIPSQGYCPYSETSNTTNCRFLHAQNALYLPDIHCPHTAINSAVCVDACLSSCSNCDSNAFCSVSGIALDGTVSYGCQCKDGYVGNGQAGQCSPATCTAQWQCPGTYNFIQCTGSTGRCGCRNTFTWDPIASEAGCVCPSGTGYINYNNGQAECLDTGRCREQYQCAQQLGINYNNVKCTSYGSNPYLPSGVNSCICNPGFEGNLNVPCQCPSGKSVIWSSSVGGNVCLGSGQCTDNLHCGYGHTCNAGWPLGTCV